MRPRFELAGCGHEARATGMTYREGGGEASAAWCIGGAAVYAPTVTDAVLAPATQLCRP